MDELKATRRASALRRRARRREGMTLIEVMIAMGILSVGLLALLALQIEALESGRTGRHVTDAARIARDRLETFQRLDWGDSALQDTGGWTDPTTVTSTVRMPDGSNAPEETYEVEWRITQDSTDPNLRFIDVRVTWTEGGGQNVEQKRFAMSSVRHDDPEF